MKLIERVPAQLQIFAGVMGLITLAATLAIGTIAGLPHDGLELTRAQLLFGFYKLLLILTGLSFLACLYTMCLPQKKGAP